MSHDDAVFQKAKKFVTILRKTEALPPLKMQAYQRKLQERLVRHAKAQVPFYDKRLNPLFGPKDTIRWEAWTDIEPFTRSQAQDAGDALYAKSTPSQAGDHSVETTSGSTGMPLKVRTSALVGLMSKAINQRIFDWHGINPDHSVCFILEFANKPSGPEGDTRNNWNLVNSGAIAHMLSAKYSVEHQVTWVKRKEPDILCTYPKNGAAIIEEFQRLGLSVPFHTLIANGETVEEDTHRIAEYAGVKIIDRYGTTESGPLSVNCPLGRWHHQFSEAALMESMSTNGQQSNFQDTKSLIITSFYNYAMPMIRYRNGDLVILSDDPCPCGRLLPRIERVLGRERNMFTFSDGTCLRPDMTRSDYEPFLSAKQFQVIQHTVRRIEVRYVADNVEKTVDIQGLTRLMQNILHHSIELEVTQVDQITRSASGKFETWKSKVA